MSPRRVLADIRDGSVFVFFLAAAFVLLWVIA